MFQAQAVRTKLEYLQIVDENSQVPPEFRARKINSSIGKKHFSTTIGEFLNMITSRYREKAVLSKPENNKWFSTQSDVLTNKTPDTHSTRDLAT
jgi:hypothetical protein